MEILVGKLDKNSKYSLRLQNIVNLKERNNARCQGADQQSANYVYRMMEMNQIVTDLMMDKMDERTAKYWEEHAEEKAALLKEKQEHKDAIKAIEQEANQVNAREELEPLNRELKEMEKEMADCGKDRLAAANKAVADATREKETIGSFQFSAKKAAKEKLEDAEDSLAAAKHTVQQEKSKIQSRIDRKKNEISAIEKRVEAERQNILKGRTPHNQRISAIDKELTRQR